MKKEKSKPTDKTEEHAKFENAVKSIFSITPERVAEIKKKVPYPKEERTQAEYDEIISIYPPSN